MVMVEFSYALTLSAIYSIVLYYRSQIKNHLLDRNRTPDFRNINNEYARLPLLVDNALGRRGYTTGYDCMPTLVYKNRK